MCYVQLNQFYKSIKKATLLSVLRRNYNSTYVSVQLPSTKYDGCFRTQEFEPMTRQLRVRECFLVTRRGFAQCGP
jgi:hypothetical protein